MNRLIQISTVIFCMSFLLTGCRIVIHTHQDTDGFSFNEKGITGSGVLATEKRAIGSFNQIYVTHGIKVYVTQGTSDELTVKADDNILPYIKTAVFNGELRVEFASSISVRKSQGMEVYVTTPNLTELKVSSGGDIISESPLELKQLALSASSGGSISLRLTAKLLSVNASSGADIIVKGEAKQISVNASSGSSVYAGELKTESSSAQVSSAASVCLFTTETTSYSVSSAGKLNYSGTPRVSSAQVSSGGRVTF